MALPCLRSGASRHVLSNSTATVLFASFSTSTPVEAAKKVLKAQVKKKTPIRKASPTGPRSPKRRAGGGGESASISRSNPFLQPKNTMSHLTQLLPEMATPDRLHGNFAWSERTLEATRIQGFGLTREMARQFVSVPRPSSVLRPLTMELFDVLDQAAASSSSSSNSLLQGPIGSGASTLLLQSFSYALESSWVVIYVPRSINLVDSSSPYAYNEALQTYLQPAIARTMLEKILSVNKSVIANMSTRSESVSLDKGPAIEAGTLLTEVIQEGLKSTATPVATQQVLELVLKTLVQQTDVPVLMAIDSAQALFSTSSYRDADYRQLKSYELAIPRLLHACLRKTGAGSFGGIQRGKVLLALSLQHKEWPAPVELRRALRLNHVDAYTKMDDTMQQIVEECQIDKIEVGSALAKEEAASLFEIARSQGGLWSAADDEVLLAKLVESGGNLGTFHRSLRSSIL